LLDMSNSIELKPHEGLVKVLIGSVVIAESKSAIQLLEGDLPTCFYFPSSDVTFDLLTASATVTHCPYKGDANYWHVTVDGVTHENIVWAYNSPISSVLPIAGYMSFYNNRVEFVGLSK
jgi:uncharacterized protein (DUF427 family)